MTHPMKEECNDWRSAPPIQSHHPRFVTSNTRQAIDTNVPRKPHHWLTNAMDNQATHCSTGRHARDWACAAGQHSHLTTTVPCGRPQFRLHKIRVFSSTPTAASHLDGCPGTPGLLAQFLLSGYIPRPELNPV
ncbi:hypothetical protein BCR44DRAFT_1439813, partial [Catenaria anguillulae PL171]